MKRNNPLRVGPLRVNHMKVPYLLSLTLVALYGCTPYSESFDCPPGHGVGCKSLSVINQMVEEGKLPLEGNTSLESVLESSSHKGKPLTDQGLIQAQNAQTPHSLVKSLPKIPPAQNTHMKVWLAAYEDQGIIHEPSTVYVALKEDPSFVVTKEDVSQGGISQAEALRAKAPPAERFPVRNN